MPPSEPLNEEDEAPIRDVSDEDMIIFASNGMFLLIQSSATASSSPKNWQQAEGENLYCAIFIKRAPKSNNVINPFIHIWRDP